MILYRYLRLFVYFVRFSFSRSLEFRLDFFFRIAMDCIYYAVNILFFKVLYAQVGSIGGWTEPQTMVFVAGFLILDAISMTLFANNTYHLPLLVNKGDVDYYLIRPVSSLFFLSLRDFAVNSFLNLVISVGILFWAASRLDPPLTWLGGLGFTAAILCGTLLYYCLRIIFILPVFWTGSGRGLEQIIWSFSKFAERPDRIFTGWGRRILLTVLPFCVMASFPARLVLEGFSWIVLGHLVGMTVLYFLFLLFLWEKATRAYTSASA